MLRWIVIWFAQLNSLVHYRNLLSEFMAAKGAFPIKVESNLRGFAHVLKSAACEWLLLFFLLLDAAFSYFLTKFAEYCELQVPCILCSRLDHVLGKEKPDFYKNLLCSSHKLEISSLVSCHSHGKLVDVHGMCEECILSFAKNESNEETYRILVAKLGSDCLQKPLLNLDSGSCSWTTKFCACCSKPWRSRPNVQKFVQSKPSSPVSLPDTSLPKSPGDRCLYCQEGLKKRRDRFSLSSTPLLLGSTDYDSLSHVGYTEVKISSNSESDFSFSDEDENISVPRSLSSPVSKFIPKSQYDDVSSAVQCSIPATNNLMFPHLEPEKGETTTPRFLVSNGDLRPGVGELNLQQVIKRVSPAAPELGSLDDIPLASSALDGSPAVLADKGDRVSLSKKFGASEYSDFISHNSALPSKHLQLPARLSKQKCIKTRELGDSGPSATNNWESIDLNSTSTDSVRKNVAFVPISSSSIGARDLASSTNKDVKASSIFSEKLCKRAGSGIIRSPEEPTAPKTSDSQTDSSLSSINNTSNGHTGEPRKFERTNSSIESQMPPKLPISDAQIDSLSSNINSTMNGHTDEPQKVEGTSSSIESQMPSKLPSASDAQIDSLSSNINSNLNSHADEPQKVESTSNSIESQMPPKPPTMERSHSLESLEESVSEIEGQSLVDQLRRQVEYDRKCIKDLHQELEAERNAAAIAANQAMAMITKLQEEKAALNMEALQYLRMMEEQAEYDVDALEKANDMIAEKEKEIQELEAELDYFRIKYPDDFPELNEEILFAEDALGSEGESIEIENS